MKDKLIVNPASRLFVGLCPVVAAASCGVNGLALGVILLAVLLCSAIVNAVLFTFIKNPARLPVAIVVIAAFTCAAQIIANALFADIAAELGVFLPLCAVGCILTCLPGYAEDKLLPIGLAVKAGVAAVVTLTLIGCIRELLADGSIFGKALLNGSVYAAAFPVSAFLLLGIIAAVAGACCRGKEAE